MTIQAKPCCERHNFYSSSINGGTSFLLLSGFLTAMSQEITCAHKGWALDNVALANDVTKMTKEDVSSAPAEGA